MKNSAFDNETKPAPFNPPDGWKAQTEFGFMGYDGTPEGRLVRLADVLKWVIKNPIEKPYPVALKAFCDAMPEDILNWLYRVEGGYAKLYEDHQFTYFTQKQFDENRKKNEANFKWGKSLERIGRPFKYTPEPTTGAIEIPGLPSLRRFISSAWGSQYFNDFQPTCDRLNSFSSQLAVPMEKAVNHWGWGAVAAPTYQAIPMTFDELVKFRVANKGTIWTLEQKRILKKEIDRLLSSFSPEGAAKMVAEGLGITVSALNQVLAAWNTEGKRAKKRVGVE